jgi:DNA-binding transcriptional LysR family regulator
MIELKFLQPILVLAEKGSFRKAALALNISQPALTKTIQNAEAFYEVKLFERSRLGVVATPFGEIIAERAHLLLQDAETISRDVRAVAQLEGGELRLGLGPYTAEALKKETIGSFLSRYPKVRLRIWIGHWEYLVNELLSRKIDIYVGDVRQLETLDAVEVIDLAGEDIAWYCGPGHPLLKKKTILPRDVAVFPFVAPYRPHRYTEWLKQIFKGTSLIQPNGGITFGLECDDYDVLRRAVATSQCVGALPRSSLRDALLTGELVELPFRPPGPRTGAGIAYLKNRMLPPPAEILIKDIIDHFQRVKRGS